MAYFKFPYFDKDFSYYRDFTCHCGSKEVVHLSETSISFFEGSFMCCHCGKSVIDGEELNYYHPLFTTYSLEKQLTLF